MRFEEESKAYQALNVLKQTDAEGRTRLLVAVVERGEDGVVLAKEGAVGTATGSTRRDQALLGPIEGEVRGA